MTYMELLRRLASLSDEQLKRPVLLRSFNKGVTRYEVDRFCVFNDGDDSNTTGEVELQISVKLSS